MMALVDACAFLRYRTRMKFAAKSVYDSITQSEHAEQRAFQQKLDTYLAEIEVSRRELVVDAASGQKRRKRDDEIDHAKRPTDDEFFRWNELWWKTFGSQPSSSAAD